MGQSAASKRTQPRMTPLETRLKILARTIPNVSETGGMLALFQQIEKERRLTNKTRVHTALHYLLMVWAQQCITARLQHHKILTILAALSRLKEPAAAEDSAWKVRMVAIYALAGLSTAPHVRFFQHLWDHETEQAVKTALALAIAAHSQGKAGVLLKYFAASLQTDKSTALKAMDVIGWTGNAEQDRLLQTLRHKISSS